MSNQPRRYLGEPYADFRRRMADYKQSRADEIAGKTIDKANAQIENDRDVHEREQVLTLQALRRLSIKPLLGEIVELTQSGISKALVTHQPRRLSPSENDQAFIPTTNFFRECTPDEIGDVNEGGENNEVDLTLAPDALYGWRKPRYLKRIKRVDVAVGMRGRLLWAFSHHPLGSSVAENWLMIVDDPTLSVLDNPNANNIVDSVKESVAGVVAGVSDAGGYALLTIDLSDGGTVTASMTLADAPSKGVCGVVTYNSEGEAIFTSTDTGNANEKDAA